jgi:hypothetical protein
LRRLDKSHHSCNKGLDDLPNETRTLGLNHVEDVMRSKIMAAALAAAVAGAAILATGTDATALRFRDDVYYYSSVTPAFGHTPSRHFYRWMWAYAGPGAYCARLRSYDPLTGTYVGSHGVRRPCP